MKYLLVVIAVIAALAAFKYPTFIKEDPPSVISEDLQSLSSDGFSFLVFGDWGRRGDYYQQAVAWQMGVAAEKVGSNFVFGTGDNFYSDGVESLHDDHWEESFESIYTAQSLMKPWYMILGNHDYRGSIKAQFDYSSISVRWKIPAKYYTFSQEINDSVAVQFIAVDTTPFVTEYRKKRRFRHVEWEEPEIQLQWLDSVLTASTADWKIVIGHHPIYSAGSKHGDTPELIQQLKPVLHKHQVQAYFSGHEHDLQHLRDAKELNYFVSGAGSKIRKSGWKDISLFGKGTAGFMIVTFLGNEMEVRCVDDKGEIIYNTTLNLQ